MLEELKEAVELVKKRLEVNWEIEDVKRYTKAIDMLCSFAQAALESEMPDKKPKLIMVQHTNGIEHPMTDIYAEGYNACHDAFLPYIAKLEAKIKELEGKK
jgi:hypothetical protein